LLDLDAAGAVVETVCRVCVLGRYVAYLADDCELPTLVKALSTVVKYNIPGRAFRRRP
jgi:hypothetical protein